MPEIRAHGLGRNAGACVLLGLLGSSFVLAADGWRRTGDAELVTLSADGAITLRASQPATAGVISDPIKVPRGANAVLIEAAASDAKAGSIAFAVFDASSGECVGYWRNPLPIRNTTTIAAALPFSASPSAIRIFAGTHGQPSSVRAGDIRHTMLRRGMSHLNAVYGARVDRGRSVRQTFRATGTRLAAAIIRIHQAQGFRDDANLVVRLYPWRKDMATSTGLRPLAESIIAGNQIPGTRQGATEDLDLPATYLHGARELTVPLGAPTRRGQTYVLELAVDSSAGEDTAFVTFGWLDGYRHGELYENNGTRGRQWDLRLETYDVAE